MVHEIPTARRLFNCASFDTLVIHERALITDITEDCKDPTFQGTPAAIYRYFFEHTPQRSIHLSELVDLSLPTHLLWLVELHEAPRPLDGHVEVARPEARHDLECLEPRRVVADDARDPCRLLMVQQVFRVSGAGQLVEDERSFVLLAVLVNQAQQRVRLRDLQRKTGTSAARWGRYPPSALGGRLSRRRESVRLRD